jgi:hypothetical protein
VYLLKGCFGVVELISSGGEDLIGVARKPM